MTQTQRKPRRRRVACSRFLSRMLELTVRKLACAFWFQRLKWADAGRGAVVPHDWMLVLLLMLLLPVTQLVTSSNIHVHICIFRIVCLVTLLIFLHSLHLNTQLNVSTSVISSTYTYFCVLVSRVWRLFFLVFIFLGRLLVLYFSLVAPAICCMFFLHVVLYVFLANKW